VNVLPKLAEWSKELSPWLSDMARRAVQKGSLDAADLDDVEALLLAFVEIPDLKNRKPVRLDDSMIPGEITSSDTVSLTAIRGPVNVNALDKNAELTFGKEGLTVVWGQNGAGKSGFTRILKKACRSRDQETILPNVFLSGPSSAAQAKLEWVSASTDKSFDWVDGKTRNDELSKIVIFDGRCARLFIDDEQEVNIVVYGVDVLREMARGCQELKQHLEQRQATCRVDLTAFDTLKGQTSVGQFIESLSATSNKQAATDLATVSPEEQKELESLNEQLSTDPLKKAAELRRRIQRYKLFLGEIQGVKSKLADDKIEIYRTAMTNFNRAGEASRIASEELHEDGHVLPGTGNEAWRELMNSALAYAGEAYPGEEFPANRSDVRCVLCQQDLGEEGKVRLKRFVQFLQADQQKKREHARKVSLDLYKAFEAISLDLPSDKTTLDEVAEINPQIKTAYLQQVTALSARRDGLVKEARNRQVPVFDSLPTGLDELVEVMWRGLEEQATGFEKAARADTRKQMTIRQSELAAKIKLKEFMPAVIKAIDSFALQKKLDQAIKATSTLVITRKSTELTEAAIAGGLNTALNEELEHLKISGLKLEIGLRGQKGQGMQQLRLNMKLPSKAKVSDILSEGEQRAIAIACFLAETNLVSAKASMVFDDPVSSVDHLRRERIATRLAKEACKRQVIVFTHDLSFAWDLTQAAEKHRTPYYACRVYSSSTGKGMMLPGLPHEGGKLGARINDLEQTAAKAKKALEVDKDGEKYDLMVRDGYRKLRDAWERLIEECLFGDAVRRFRNSVQTQRLRYAEVQDSDVVAVDEGMTRCSMFTHDAPVEAAPTLPTPDEFLTDIKHLQTTYDLISARMKETEKRRKAA
jgi:energy-coupling factor transporter ATP-binding protein EcfA2